MDSIQNDNKISVSGPLPVLFVSMLSLCLLLSSCQGSGKNSNVVSTQITQPGVAINTTLKEQGETYLQTFQQWISLMQQYGGNIHPYQLQYNSDQQALRLAPGISAYNAALTTMQKHIEAIKIPAMKSEAQTLKHKLQQAANTWENQHPYHDTYNNTTYHMGFEYDSKTGIGSWVQNDLDNAQNLADYQQIIENLNMYLTNFQAMQANSRDQTPYNLVHQTDLQLIKAYGQTKQKVLIISLSEQAMRVYDHDRLVNAFLVTTGRPEKPSRPGSWWVESHEQNVIFKADVPPGDPSWYPDTPINYAMQYHSDGYYIHDSWWRVEYGPYTQFPHQDVTGDTGADLGTHGCINMAKTDAQWVYNFATLFTGIIIY